MSQTGFAYFVIGLAFVAANLPFLISDNFRQRPVRLSWRLGLLVLLYFVVGAIGFTIESNLGKTTGQNWEFYAITATLFITFAFPSFIYRYLLRRT
jgi:Protein of unknown function (DUF2818)